MRRVLGPDAPWQAVKRAARNSFRNYAKTLVDFLRFPHMEQSEIDSAVPIRYGMEHLFEAQKRATARWLSAGISAIGTWRPR